MTEPDEGMIARILALLAKAERTDNEHEANAYFAKASALQFKYAIEQSQLTPAQREQITLKECEESKNKYDQQLLTAIARNAGVYHVVYYVSRNRYESGGKNGGVSHGTLTGLPTDIRYVESLYASLVITRESALRASLARGEKPEGQHGKAYGMAFRMAFAERANARMVERNNVNAADSAPGNALVLVDNLSKARQFALNSDENIRSSTYKYSTKSAEGSRAGHDAANRADVFGGRNNIANNGRQLSA